MNRDEGIALVREHVKNEGLIRHMLSVEACMRLYAEKFGEDVQTWGLLGLIHDFDWEIHPTLEEHPSKGAPILRERGVPEDLIQDILSHGIGTGVPGVGFALVVMFGVKQLGRLFKAVTRLECWVRRVTAVVMMLVGVHLSLVYIFNVDIFA